MAPRTYSPRSEEIRKASKPPRASRSFDIEAEAKSAHTVRLPRESEENFRSGKAARAGLNRAWFCGKCGGYHPKGQVVCDGAQRKDDGRAQG